MHAFAPEFSQFWLAAGAAGADHAHTEAGDDESRSLKAALEELAERVNAARSIY